MTPAPQLTVGIRNFSPEPGTDWSYVLDQARAAEEAGIDRVFVVDHLVFGGDLSAYGDPRSGGVVGGVQPTGPDGEWLEALTTLAAMTAVTQRVRLATNVLVVPLRSAVLLAKVTATLDALSGGRFELGAGIGWQEAEYRAAGVEFSDRGRILDETLEACRDLWTSPEGSFVGRGYSLAGMHMMPKPRDPAGIPVWIGGRPLPRVARRLARFGSGWLPWGATPETFLGLRDQMARLVEAEGRDFSTLRVAYTLPTALTESRQLDYDTMLAPVAQLAEHGISDFRTLVRIPAEHAVARDFLAELRQRFDAASARPSGPAA